MYCLACWSLVVVWISQLRVLPVEHCRAVKSIFVYFSNFFGLASACGFGTHFKLMDTNLLKWCRPKCNCLSNQLYIFKGSSASQRDGIKVLRYSKFCKSSHSPYVLHSILNTSLMIGNLNTAKLGKKIGMYWFACWSLMTLEYFNSERCQWSMMVRSLVKRVRRMCVSFSKLVVWSGHISSVLIPSWWISFCCSRGCR